MREFVFYIVLILGIFLSQKINKYFLYFSSYAYRFEIRYRILWPLVSHITRYVGCFIVFSMRPNISFSNKLWPKMLFIWQFSTSIYFLRSSNVCE